MSDLRSLDLALPTIFLNIRILRRAGQDRIAPKRRLYSIESKNSLPDCDEPHNMFSTEPILMFWPGAQRLRIYIHIYIYIYISVNLCHILNIFVYYIFVYIFVYVCFSLSVLCPLFSAQALGLSSRHQTPSAEKDVESKGALTQIQNIRRYPTCSCYV